MTKFDREHNEDRLAAELKQTWEQLESAYPAPSVSSPYWTALVEQTRRTNRKKLWRDLALLWAIAIPFLFGFMLLASGLSPWFWLLQGIFIMAGFPLVASEYRSYRRKEGAVHE